MQRTNVTSSNIDSIGYDGLTSTLEIEFNDGGIYQYFNVPENVYRSLMNSSSHGAYFHDNIKDKYRFRKIN
ncbi:MAG: KTSC domain-containing protein [Patescibacteria group bacterium]